MEGVLTANESFVIIKNPALVAGAEAKILSDANPNIKKTKLKRQSKRNARRDTEKLDINGIFKKGRTNHILKIIY